MKCCGNCEYHRQSKLKIQFNEIPITAYCTNKNSQYCDKYVWDDENCDEWKGADVCKKIKEGEWVTDKVYYAGNGKLSGFTAKCSECGFTYKTNYSDYCPGCGTKMKIDKWWKDNG